MIRDRSGGSHAIGGMGNGGIRQSRAPATVRTGFRRPGTHPGAARIRSARGTRAVPFLLAGLALCLLHPRPAWTQTGVAGDTAAGGHATADGPAEWEFAIRPYFFLSGVSGSVTADPVTLPINSRFSDLLDNVRVGAFLAFTAEKGRWGFHTDFEYIRLVGEGTSSLDAALELENLIGEADVTLRPSRESTLKFLAGVRVYWVQQTLSVRGESLPEVDTTVLDPVLGAHGSWALGRTWGFEMRGDIGGFGVGSEFTYQLLTLFRWEISRALSLPFGYRVLGYQIRDENVWMNTRMGGLLLGVDFRF